MLKRKSHLKVLLSFALVLAVLLSILCGIAPLSKSVSSASVPTGRPSDGGVEDQKIIWKYFMEKLGNPIGVAGLMGNLYAESGLRTNNLQNSFENRLGYNDVTYTKAVDDGTYKKFINDSAGYGLAQWTYSTRKMNLLYFAQDRGVSIADFKMQLDFLDQELNSSFWRLVDKLKNATSILEASNAVLFDFERPADQSTYVQNTRKSYSQSFYNRYKDLPLDDTPTATETQKPTEPVETYTPGDVDDNGKIDSTDYILIKRHLLKLNTLEGKALKAADANEDKKIDSTDYITVKRMILFKAKAS